MRKPSTYQIIAVLVSLFILYLILFYKKIENIADKLPKHAFRKFSKRSLSDIEQIVVHHSAGNENDSIEQIANYHIGSNHVCDEGCPGILYHFMIDRQGNVYQVNALTSITWHLSGQNTRSVGICFIGNYDNYKPTKKQLRAFTKAVRYVNRQVGKTLSITTHSKACSGCTACPGQNLKSIV